MVNKKILINILKKKIKDEDVIYLIKTILDNFGEKKGMPLGNYTSQFFANIYLNELDYYVKNVLKAKYYIRYVDDFVIIHQNKKRLEYFLKHIIKFLPYLKIEIHKDKTKIIPIQKGIDFLGYRVFYHHRLLRKRNLNYFKKRLEENLNLLQNKEINEEQFNAKISGWLGYMQILEIVIIC